jgi:hypothetical protein
MIDLSLGSSIHLLELTAVCATFWRIGELLAAPLK